MREQKRKEEGREEKRREEEEEEKNNEKRSSKKIKGMELVGFWVWNSKVCMDFHEIVWISMELYG